MSNFRSIKNPSIAVIGIGYVGLPLSIEFGKKYNTIGFDINNYRISELKKFNDKTNEVSKTEIKRSKYLNFTSNPDDLKIANIYIVTVPTPILKNKTPDLRPIKKATSLISKFIKKTDIVIYESTVYPGLTEDICVKILEKKSGLIFNKDFYCGYSPERINPGDKKNKIYNISKIVSGSNRKTLQIIYKLYSSIIRAKIYKAQSIKVAEAAKVIENSQRDLNVAFINELSIIFNSLNINTNDVLNAAGTKWNFLKFKPGLVGGHCIGVDPYYLTYKAKKSGYNSKVILSGRQINNNMGNFITRTFLNKLKKIKNIKEKSNVLIMGFTFKENCQDIRNTQVISIYNELINKKINVDIYDPLVDPLDLKKIHNLSKINNVKKNSYDGIILAVSHDNFKKLGIKKIRNFCKVNSIIFDVKSIFPREKDLMRL